MESTRGFRFQGPLTSPANGELASVISMEAVVGYGLMEQISCLSKTRVIVQLNGNRFCVGQPVLAGAVSKHNSFCTLNIHLQQ